MDPIADFLTRIRNASLARLEAIEAPYSNMRHNIAKILQKEGYVNEIKVDDTTPNKKNLLVTLAYEYPAGNKRHPKITAINRVSKPGRRVYTTKENIPRPLRGFGTVIISTSKGVYTGKEASKLGLGGEIVCEIW